ncbi:hypothetical protein [Zavarzinella formosa]|uniref:hypothetical protein n=1 Tax=Zavarzinella formosa TaxID=360055 RepID=UPI00031FEBF4|nr:hypothetical protein [Zavarzinella formosa]
MTRTHRVRLSIVGITALLVSLLAIQPGHSQFSGRPTGISGISGRPPGFSGISGGISGISGGISGISGRTGISGMPDIPRGISGISGISGMPDRSGITGISGRTGISGIGGGGISGIGGGGIIQPPPIPQPIIPGFRGRDDINGPNDFTGIYGGAGGGSGMGGGSGQTVYEWSCSRCGFVVSVGPTRPSASTCPSCRARLSGGSGGSRSDGPTLKMPEGFGNLLKQPPVPSSPEPENFTGPSVKSGAAPSSPPSASTTEAPPAPKGRWRMVLLIAGGLALLIVAALVIIHSAIPKEGTKKSKPTKNAANGKPKWLGNTDHQPRRRRGNQDDDD